MSIKFRKKEKKKNPECCIKSKSTPKASLLSPQSFLPFGETLTSHLPYSLLSRHVSSPLANIKHLKCRSGKVKIIRRNNVEWRLMFIYRPTAQNKPWQPLSFHTQSSRMKRSYRWAIRQHKEKRFIL